MIRAKIVALILSVFGVHGHQAVDVATCESKLQPSVVSHGNVGLFQVNQIHRRRGESFASFARRMKDPRTNVLFAWRLSRHGTDFSPWRWSQRCWS